MNAAKSLNRHWPLAAIAIIAFAALLAFLSQKGHQIEEVREIKIGALLSLTGENANYGTRSLHGALWAVEKINQRGGLGGVPIHLVIADTKSNPKDAVSAYRKLVDSDGVQIVVGDIISGTTLAVAPLAQREKVLLFAPGASNPKLTDAGEYVFRNWTSDSFDGETIARYARSRNDMSVGIMVENTDYTMGLANAFAREFEALEGRVIGKYEFDSKSLDFRNTLEKIKNDMPSAIYVSAYSAQSGRIIRQAREIGIEYNFYATLTVNTPECLQIAGDAIDGVSFTTPALDLEADTKVVRDFVDGFVEKFGEEPEDAAAHAYDAILMLSSIWPDGTNPTAEELKDRLADLHDYPGVTGTMSMDKNGDVVKSINIKRFVKGEPLLIETIQPTL